MAIASLGPDVLADDFDPGVAAARAAEHASRTIAEVLLDQRIAAGIGNIYKSEALFAAGVDPRRRVATLDVDTLTAIYAAARTQMRANLGPEPRTTRQSLAGAPKDARYFVYSRSGKPCPRCQTTIACISQGDNPPRWTWWCPTCQPAPA
jgi:endonuclease-8